MVKQAGFVHVRVTCVSYMNAIPFIYGLDNSVFSNMFSLRVMPPSKCLTSFKKHETDIALIPTAALIEIENPSIILPFCIGADGPISSVFLLSNQPLENISTIFLDVHSVTSNKLVELLCHRFWKISPVIRFPDCYPPKLTSADAIVAIGDKSFNMVENFKYRFDLAEEWKKFTQLPFVFAVWLTHIPNETQILRAFNESLNYSITHIRESIDYCQPTILPVDKIYQYLTKSVIYQLNDRMLQGLFKFLSFLDPEAEQRLKFINV